MRHIPYARQDISDDDVQGVVNVLRSDFLTQGPVIEEFERAIANYCGVKYAVAVNSATSALHIACLALGLQEGQTLWTSPNTFVASANCGLYCGATVDFVDIDPNTYNLSISALKEKLEQTRQKGNLPKVVVPVHFSGQSCDMEAIYGLAKEFGFSIIEDASHALGGRYKDEAIGCCRFSDMTVLSFHPVKILTTGEGGMVLTNRADLYEQLKLLRSHGITRVPSQMTEASHGPWYYQQVDLGFNYRITDIHAALGLSQMTRLDEFVSRRHRIAEKYNTALQGLPVRLPWQDASNYSAFHLYVIRVETELIGKTHLEIFESLRARGIGVNLHYIPVHMQPYYKELGFKEGDFPESERYYRQAISLPMYYGLLETEQDYVIAQLREILQ